MNYCYKLVDKWKTVRLVFKREQLIYDIENSAFIEGDIIPEDEYSRHQVMDVAQEGNVDRVTRILDLAHAECVEMLYPYTKETIEKEKSEINDELNETDEYIIELHLPDFFSGTTVRLLEVLIHEYFVCRSLSDWMSITHPDSQLKWEAKVEDIKDKMQTALSSRIGKVRRRMNPF